MSINRVIITGNLTRDPELRATASGMSVLSLGVAVNERRKNKQTSVWEDHPVFVDCTMFGTRAEAVSRYLAKGSKVAIEGKLRWSQWERDGEKRSKIDVTVDEIEFMSAKNEYGTPQPSYEPTYAPQAAQAYTAPAYAPAGQPAAALIPASQPVAAPASVQPTLRPTQPTMAAPAPAAQQVPSIYDEDIPF